MPQLTLHLLGPPQLELKGTPLVVDRRKAIALLVYLALHTHPQSRDSLAALFWPDYDQQSARNNLRRTLSILKQALEEEWLEIDQGRVTLKQNEGLWVDVVQFQRLLERCRGHEYTPNGDCPACLPLLAEAASLYRDDFLAGFTLQDSPGFDDWQLFQTERLRQELAGALAQLAQGYAGQGEFKTALAYGQRWLSLDPLHEPAHRCLMQLYAQAGDRAAALRQYQACVRLLQAELGLSPSPETVQLYEAIKATQEDMEAGRQGNRGIIQNPKSPQGLLGSAKPPGGEIQNPHNLPVHLTPLLGREAELRKLGQLLAEPDLRLISLVGPGGIGKTHLALEAARQQLRQFPDGVYFVSLAPIEAPEAMIATVAKAINFSFYAGVSPQQQLCDYLRQKSLLLVLDNFEHLLVPPSSPLSGETKEGLTGGAALVMAWLQAAPALKILVTSHSRLKVQGEQQFPLEGIGFPSGEETPQEISRYSAVQLFLQTAHRLRPDFQLTHTEALAVAQLCWLMQGMPLGILLAAAWIDLFKPSEIAHQIGQSLDFLVSDWQDLPPRQQSLRAVFDHSWRLLTERERFIFQQVSIFRGGFSHEAVQAVIGASLPELRALVNKSLLRRTEAGRYEIHELLRQYGAEKLAQTPTTEAAVRDRHSAHYCSFLQRREADLKGARQQLALTEIEEAHENIRLAWVWAAEQAQVERLAQAMDSLGVFYQWRGRCQEGEVVYRDAVAKLIMTSSGNKQPVAFSNGLRVLIALLSWQADFSYILGQFERAEALLQQGLALINSPELANQDVRLEKAKILRLIGTIAEINHRENARLLLEESLAIYRSLNDKEGIARLLNLLSQVVMNEGELAENERMAQESLAIYREIGSQTQIALGLHYLGMKFLMLGRFVETHVLSEESVMIQSNYGARGQLVEASITLGWAKVMLGRYEEAHILLHQTLRLAKEIGYKNKVGSAFALLGWVALAETAYTEAQQFLQQKSRITREMGQHEDGVTPAMLGCVVRSLGQISQARQYLVEALRLAIESRSFQGLMFTLPTLALLLIDQEQTERAVELYALASHHPFVANSRWFEDVAGRHIAAAARTLPPEVVAAAQARGTARDLWATAAELMAELERGGEPGLPG